METYFQTSPEPSAVLDAIRTLFGNAGWDVRIALEARREEDVILTNGHGEAYYAVLKTFGEGRSDRVVASFAQALLEARSRGKRWEGRPAILIWVNTVSPHLVKRLVDFHRENGDGEPVAVFSPSGVLYASFPGLHIESAGKQERSPPNSHSAPPRLVFSDMNQWMLKLLLAVDIKGEGLIRAPENTRFSTASELARSAGCSVMTATRLVNALREGGFLEPASYFLNLVRRNKLAERWKAEYQQPALAVPVKFLTPMPPDAQLRKLLKAEGGILGQFAAAEQLGVGHVRGVPSTLWVPNLAVVDSWRATRRVREGERPDLIVQQPKFPQSLFRGAVVRDGLRVTDIIQTWLDVSAHPARGAEQAAELEHGILSNLIGEGA